MSIQSILALSASVLAALYFLRAAAQDLSAPTGGSCGKCSSGGCPVAKKG
jgi:hypothetical protein